MEHTTLKVTHSDKIPGEKSAQDKLGRDWGHKSREESWRVEGGTAWPLCIIG